MVVEVAVTMCTAPHDHEGLVDDAFGRVLHGAALGYISFRVGHHHTNAMVASQEHVMSTINQ